MKSAPVSTDLSEDARVFGERLERLATLLRQDEILLLPYHSRALPIFSALGADEKRTAAAELERVLAVFEQVRAEGYRLVDTPQLLWRSLRTLGFVWEGDVFDKITRDDVVQAFSADHKMVFWNLRLLHMVSFTIEQMFCSPWWTMGQRVPDVSAQAFAAVSGILEGRLSGTFDPAIPEHVVSEEGSAELLKFRIRIKWFSPLRRGGKVDGFLVINDAQQL